MSPLRLAAIGLLLVLVDIKLGAFSLSLDWLGWLMVLGGLSQVASLNRWLVWARNLAAVALIASVVAMLSFSGSFAAVAAAVVALAVPVLVFCTCTGLLLRLYQRDKGYRGSLQVLRFAAPILVLAGFAVRMVDVDRSVGLVLYGLELAVTVALAAVLWLLGKRYTFSG